jgi:hypothetical protein
MSEGDINIAASQWYPAERGKKGDELSACLSLIKPE